MSVQTAMHVPHATQPSRVLALVLNWNGASDTLACLESLKRQSHPALEVLVIDNASTDDSVAEIRAARSDIELVRNRENLGYAGGNNVGLRLALERDVPLVLVLNNDTVLDPDCVAALVQAAVEHPEAAALAPKSYLYGKSDQLYSAGGTWDPTGYPRLIGFRERDGVEFEAARTSDWLSGCALLLRSESLARIGLFDERFFHTFEDTDWSLRARRAGYELRVVPQARLAHRVGRSLGGSQTATYTYYYTRSHLLFIELNFRGWARVRATYGAFVRARRALRRARKRQPASVRAIRRALFRALSDYWRGHLGRRPT